MAYPLAMQDSSGYSSPVAALQEGGMMIEGYWWCDVCLKEVHAACVTYEEKHDGCGHPVIWIDSVGKLGKCAHCDKAAVAYCPDKDAWVCLDHYTPQEQAPWAAKVTELTAEVEKLKAQLAAVTIERDELKAVLNDSAKCDLWSVLLERDSLRQKVDELQAELLSETAWAGKYLQQAHAAEEKCERYEKALKEIVNHPLVKQTIATSDLLTVGKICGIGECIRIAEAALKEKK
jgi:hypothetical protein